MYIRTITLNNFKCFEADIDPLHFAMPDGTTPGSGLNILVGENNTGKSTVFEALDFVRNGPPRGKSMDDLRNKGASSSGVVSVTIDFCGEVTAVVDAYAQKNKQEVIKKYINDNILRIIRSSDNIKELLLWDASTKEFRNEIATKKHKMQKIFLSFFPKFFGEIPFISNFHRFSRILKSA